MHGELTYKSLFNVHDVSGWHCHNQEFELKEFSHFQEILFPAGRCVYSVKIRQLVKTRYDIFCFCRQTFIPTNVIIGHLPYVTHSTFIVELAHSQGVPMLSFVS